MYRVTVAMLLSQMRNNQNQNGPVSDTNNSSDTHVFPDASDEGMGGVFHEQFLADGDALRSVADQGHVGLVVEEQIRQPLLQI